jgi:hypothetical protein
VGGRVIITNLTNVAYSFGPMYLGPFGTLELDDTSETSLYLLDDEVADAVNTLWWSSNIYVDSAADPFPRPTRNPLLLNGTGSPEGLVYAPQGSAYMRRDSVAVVTGLYTKTTGVTLNTGWASIGSPAPNGACLIGTSWSMGQASPARGADAWNSAGIVMENNAFGGNTTFGAASLCQTGLPFDVSGGGDAGVQFSIRYDDSFNTLVWDNPDALWSLIVSAYSLDGENYLGMYCTDDPATDWLPDESNNILTWAVSEYTAPFGSLFDVGDVGGGSAQGLLIADSVPIALNMSLQIYYDRD